LSHLVPGFQARHHLRMRSIVVLAALTACGSSTTAVDTHPRFENDYTGARAEAKQRHLPLAVEVWAPW
jgi:hypothetical protein